MQNTKNIDSFQQSGTGDLADLQAAVVNAAANAVVITDRDGTIIWTNPAFEELTGYTHGEAVGQSTRVLKSGKNPPALYEEMWRTILGGRVWRGELINRRKDGSPYSEEMTITPVQNSQRNITHFVAVKQDITERRRIEQEILFKNTLLEAQAETTIDGILAVDEGNRIILSNQQFEVMWRIPAEMVRAGDDNKLLQWVVDQVETPQAFLAKVQYLYSHRDEKSRDELRLKDGRVLDRYSSPLIDSVGEYRGRIWYFRDITERVKAEGRLRLWSRVLDQSAEAIFVCDPEERILIVNKAFERTTGFSAAEALGATPRILKSARHDRAFYAELWKSVQETGTWSGEMWNRRKSGELYVEWLSISAVRDQNSAVTHYVGIFSDITARKQTEERIVRLGHFDALTDLPNRVLLMDRLTQLTKSRQQRDFKIAAVFIDLDRFKEVNDSLGHDAGDLLLQAIAKRLSDAVREDDTVARIGGDEFVVVLQSLREVRDAAALVQKLLSCLVKPVTINGYELTVTASMGISLYPDDATNGQEMIRNADAAMYQAKGAGRNGYQFYTSDLNKRALEMLAMESDLRRAIERQEFELHYQPQVDISSGVVVGVEALIRWNHPDLGLVMPGKFISIAEERGLIVPIGSWVIDEALRQAAIWQHRGKLSVPIAVNVSAVQFRQKDFVEQLASSVRKHGITPNHLELELTESIVMRDAETTIKVLRSLNEIGFQLSIDDFGTGYSSLSYLRRFPIHKIKIDQSFVADLTKDESAGSIVTAIIGLARSMKLKVIAEGVQTPDQLQILRSQGCDQAQGFLFSPALGSEELGKFVRDWKPEYLGSLEFHSKIATLRGCTQGVAPHDSRQDRRAERPQSTDGCATNF